MTDDHFEKIVNEEFDDVVDLAQQDFDFVYELLRENSNADATFLLGVRPSRRGFRLSRLGGFQK